MIKRDLGPFPTPQQLNKWADKNPGSRDSVTKLVGMTSNKVRSISEALTDAGISQRRRRYGVAQLSSRKIRNLNIHKY
jgi:hypothetical protein